MLVTGSTGGIVYILAEALARAGASVILNGRVTGMAQTGAGIGAIVFTMLIGWIVDHFSYAPALIIGGILGPLATLSIFALCGKIEKT